MSTEKMIVLKSSDGETFEIENSVAVGSETIKNMIEDGCADKPIPLPNVHSKILVKVIEFLRHHRSGEDGPEGKSKPKPKPSQSEFDSEFVKVDKETLFELAYAANYLNIKNLLDVTMDTFAEMVKGKSPAEVRDILNIKCDFTPEEEEQVRQDNLWAFE